MSQDSGSIIKSAAEAFNSGNHEALGSYVDDKLAKGVGLLAGARSTAQTQYEILHTSSDGPQVSFAYLARQTVNGKESRAYGTGIAQVANGKITSIRHLTNFSTQLGGDPSLTGTWTGSAQGISVVLNLVQNPDNSVTGTATAFNATFPVTGNVNYPNVNLQGNMNGVEVTYTGTFNPPPNTITGTLTALGSSIDVPITRQ